jgi:hypothetical protein
MFKPIQLLLRSKFIVIGLALLAYAIYNPSVIPHPQLQQQASQLNQTITSQDNSWQKKASWLYHKLQEKFLIFAQKTKLPKQLTGLPEEVVVQDIVDDLTNQVKQLPQKQVKSAKTQFCQDVINDATASIAGTSTNQP